MRLAAGKRNLVVLDFVSNYNSVKDVLEMMSMLGFKFKSTSMIGGDPLFENDSVVNKIDANIPITNFVLGEKEDVYFRNCYDKETEKQLEAYIQMRRMQGARVKDIFTEESLDANYAQLDRITRRVDKKLAANTPEEIQMLKKYAILYETLEYLFNIMSKEEAFAEVKEAGVTETQFTKVWNCLENKVPKTECARQILESKRKRRH